MSATTCLSNFMRCLDNRSLWDPVCDPLALAGSGLDPACCDTIKVYERCLDRIDQLNPVLCAEEPLTAQRDALGRARTGRCDVPDQGGASDQGDAPSDQNDPPADDGNGIGVGAVIGILISVFLALAVIIFAAVMVYRRRHRPTSSGDLESRSATTSTLASGNDAIYTDPARNYPSQPQPLLPTPRSSGPLGGPLVRASPGGTATPSAAERATSFSSRSPVMIFSDDSQAPLALSLPPAPQRPKLSHETTPPQLPETDAWTPSEEELTQAVSGATPVDSTSSSTHCDMPAAEVTSKVAGVVPAPPPPPPLLLRGSMNPTLMAPARAIPPPPPPRPPQTPPY